MLLDTLAALFRRDLASLRCEIEAYPDDPGIWAAAPGLPNSGGVLIRHVCGNLQHFIGAVLGGTGYRRDREAEFGAPPCSRAQLLAEIASTEAAVLGTLQRLAPERLQAAYPQFVAGQEVDTADFLVHLVVHCGFHLGQVDYHRRAQTGDAKSVGPMGLGALASARAATRPA
jgi:hypothetical protein